MKKFFIIGVALLFLPCTLFGANLEVLERQVRELRTEYQNKIGELENKLQQVHHHSSEHHANTDLPGTSWNSHLTFNSGDGNNSLIVKGRFQFRFEHEKMQDPAENSHTSFYIRRLRLSFSGNLKSQNLTYAFSPEVSKEANMRDAWLNYSFESGVQLRIGQFQVPFSWERDSMHSSSRHHFLERSTTGEEFLWHKGDDLGIMLYDWKSSRLAYSAGLYSGQGKNQTKTNSTALVAAGRLAYVVAGEYPSLESLTDPVCGTNLLIGAGTYHANKNDARDWHPWSSAAVETADLLAFTADMAYQTGGLSAHFSKYYRTVDPMNPLINRYSGDGYNSQIGYLVKPQKVFSALRYSEGKPNREIDNDRIQEAVFSTQFFFSGHDSKLTFEFGRIRTHNGAQWHNTDISRMQYQLLF